MATVSPNPTAIIAAYFSVCAALSGLPAPIFCAPSADTVESIEDGTRKRKLMIFSTMPTAAASLKPRRFAMIVIMINAIRISPSCMATGIPILRICPIAQCCGLKSFTDNPGVLYAAGHFNGIKTSRFSIYKNLEQFERQAENETRTHDPFITSEVLYRLSYFSLYCAARNSYF